VGKSTAGCLVCSATSLLHALANSLQQLVKDVVGNRENTCYRESTGRKERRGRGGGRQEVNACTSEIGHEPQTSRERTGAHWWYNNHKTYRSKSTPVLELVLLPCHKLLGHLLLNLLVRPAIEDASLDLIQHLHTWPQ